MATGFPHEQLDCYRLAVEVARWMGRAKFPPGCADLADQGRRAARSVPLNIAEAARQGQAGANHFRIALGSAAETCAVLDLVEFPDAPEQQVKLRRIGAMLRRLSGG